MKFFVTTKCSVKTMTNNLTKLHVINSYKLSPVIIIWVVDPLLGYYYYCICAFQSSIHSIFLLFCFSC